MPDLIFMRAPPIFSGKVRVHVITSTEMSAAMVQARAAI